MIASLEQLNYSAMSCNTVNCTSPVLYLSLFLRSPSAMNSLIIVGTSDYFASFILRHRILVCNYP